MKIICIGRNYADHAKEMNAPLPVKPMFFMKPDTALLKSGAPFYYPAFSKEIHYECEVVVKIAKTGKHIAVKFAHKYYDEIGLGIDFTARDLQQECKEKGTPWEIAKAFDNSAVVSNEFIPKNKLDLDNISFSLLKNDLIVQSGNTKDFIFKIDELIAYVSQFITLRTGDLIYTGTPAGVGPVTIGDELKGFIGGQQLILTDVK